MKLMVKHKIIGLAATAAFVPVAVILILTAVQKDKAGEQVQTEMNQLARENVAQISKDVYGMLETANDLLETKLTDNLDLARLLVEDAGGFHLLEQTASWEATNQVTGETRQVRLPVMQLGEVDGQKLTANDDPDVTSPIVDATAATVGGIYSIFQRMNERGDMLRIASTVLAEDGSRAVGTFISATNADGSPNPVVQKVLAGQTFQGMAQVLGETYLATYEPIIDDGKVVGILSGAIKQEQVQSLRQAIMDITVGKTGYVYVLGGQGDDRGHYIISLNGSRDGEDIYNAKDSDGTLFIQQIVEKATELEGKEIDYQVYPWKNEGEAEARNKIAAIAYFEPWDWVIGAGTYEDDFYAAIDRVDGALNALLLASAIGGVIILLVMGLAAWLVGTRIANPVIRIRDIAREISKGKLDAENDIQSNDEVGQLADAFREMTVSLQGKAAAARAIADGDIEAEIVIASDEDQLGLAMVTMRDRIQSILGEVGGLIEAVNEGELTRRGDTQGSSGAWKQLMSGLNELIEAFVRPINVTAEYVDRISRGDIPEKITDEYKGEFNKIKSNLNRCIDAIGLLIEDTHELVGAALAGRLDARADASRHGGDFSRIVSGVNQTLDAVIAPIQEAALALEKMATGNLTRFVEGDYKGDHAKIKQALNSTLSSLNDILQQVSVAVDQVNSGSQQVSDASQSLSQGATEQASSLEEISSSMIEISSQTKLNADNADQTNQLANASRQAADNGSARMDQMVEAMQEINQSAGEISKIIKVIDEIAFQTNLLALNAAVEAARAGVHGKGFAVVAEEVRNLAGRSAKAAKETTDLIEGAIQRVERGNTIADDTSSALGEIVGGITKVTDLVNEIASASREQATGIDQVTEALGQIDQVTQANTASAEESAAAAEELSGQSEQLKQMLSRFELLDQQAAIRSERHSTPALPAAESEQQGRNGHTGAGAAKSSRGEIAPEEVINLDDEDFGDF